LSWTSITQVMGIRDRWFLDPNLKNNLTLAISWTLLLTTL
jgi:hypothetical protein